MNAANGPFPSFPDNSNFIAGRWIESASPDRLIVEDPASEEILAVVPDSGGSDVDRAVSAAKQALADPAWRDMRSHQRSEILSRIAALIADRAEEFALLECRDAGKPISDVRTIDVPEAVEVFRFMAGAPARLAGATVPVVHNGRAALSYTERVPVGVCAAIVPWNFPLVLTTYKLAAALAAGCTVVVKPSEEAPLSVLRLVELLGQAGLPDGVVNVVTGRGPGAGRALVSHPDVDKIAFTGSTQTGKAIMAMAASSIKRVSLELGGKNPGIVFADADLDAAAEGIAAAAFSNAGQICHCIERCYVARSLFDRFVDRLVEAADRHVLGDPLDPSTTIGPLISRAQKRSVTAAIRQAAEAGAWIRTRALDGPAQGHFVRPTVLTHVGHNWPIARDEVFGPVVSVIPFDDPAEAIALANDTAYGLSASIWTGSMATANSAVRAIQAGTIWVNGFGLLDSGMPFGGMKQSGLGRELSDEGLRGYTELKSVFMM